MNIYKIALLDYDRAFDLEVFAPTEEAAVAIVTKEEPHMTIKKITCLTD